MSGKPRFSDGSPAFIGVTLAAILGLCALAALLSWVGVPTGITVFVFIALVFVLTFLRSVRPPGEEDVLTRQGVFPARLNALALGVEWLSAFGLFGIVGAMFAFGHDALSLILGLAAGFVLSTVLIAPRLGRLETRSLPDYLSQRFGNGIIRWAALCVMGVVTVLLVGVQLVACGLIAEQGLGLPGWMGVVAGVSGLLLLTLPGGMRSLTSGQVLLAAVTVIAILIAAIWLLSARTGIVVPHIAWGGLLADIEAAEGRLGLEAAFGRPFAMLGGRDVMLLMLCLAVGSAAMPSLVARASASVDATQTRSALTRGLIVFLLLATVLPALGVLGRAELMDLFTEGRGEIATPPAWMLGAGTQICGGEALNIEAVRQACSGFALPTGFPFEELSFDPQRVFLSLPEMAGASPWVLGLLVAGGLTAAFVAGGGALLCFASALTSRASPIDAETHGRVALVASAVLATAFALTTGVDVLSLGAWAFSLAGASLFAPLTFGLWWPRTNGAGALAGLVGGFAVTALYIVGASWGMDLTAETGDEWSLLGLPPIVAGAFGLLVSMLLTFWVSLATKRPVRQDVAIVPAGSSGQDQR